MSNPLIPVNDNARLQELYTYDVLDTNEEKDFSDLAELAAGICNCERATITFIDKERQWFKAKKNVLIQESSRLESLCAHAILSKQLFIVNDLRKDERFSNNPHVWGKGGVSFYAGAPIISSSDFVLGTVCVMDPKPKESLTAHQQNALIILAGQVTRLLELRLKNKQIKEQADLLAIKEKLISSFSINAQDDSNSFIANELHENFAQTLAASKLYLEMAEKTTDMSSYFIKKSKQNIINVIQEIKVLSKKIAPTTFDNENYLDLITDLAEAFSSKFEIKIKLVVQGNITCLKNKHGLAVYRVIEEIMQVARYGNATKIEINIYKKSLLHIKVLHNGLIDEINMQTQAAHKQISARIQQLNAAVSTLQNQAGLNGYNIEVPLQIT